MKPILPAVPEGDFSVLEWRGGHLRVCGGKVVATIDLRDLAYADLAVPLDALIQALKSRHR